MVKNDFETTIPGAIYRTNLDASHPFSYGLGKTYCSDFNWRTKFRRGQVIYLANDTLFKNF